MKRREFISFLVSAATTWPRVARTQPSENPARIGFLPLGSPSNQYDLSYVEAFRRGLIDNGLIERQNISVAILFGGAVFQMIVRIAGSAARQIGRSS